MGAEYPSSTGVFFLVLEACFLVCALETWLAPPASSGSFHPVRVTSASNKIRTSAAMASGILRSALCMTGGLSHACERSMSSRPPVCADTDRNSASLSGSNAHSVLDPTMIGPNGMACSPVWIAPRIRVPSPRSRESENLPGAMRFHATS